AVSFVPTIGTAIVWAPITVYEFAAKGWGHGVLFLAYGIVIVGGSDNVIRPMLIKRGLEMHPLLVFVAVIGGVASFGPSGIFLGPLVMALAVSAVDIYATE